VARPSGRALAGAFALYMGLAALATSPLSGHLGSRVCYEGDSLLNTWILAHSAPALVRAPARLFDAPAFLPYRGSLAFSEHLLFPSFLAWPLRAATGNALFAHNAVVLLFLALSGFSMFLLVRELTSEAGAGLVAGALYGTHTYLVNEVQRLQIQAQCLFPLALLLLVKHFEAPRRATAAWFAVVVLACGLSNNYYLLYMPLLFALALPWVLGRGRPETRRRALGALAAALVPVALVFAVIAAQYLRVAGRYGFSRDLPVGIGLEKYAATRPENWLYGETVPGVRLQTQAAHFTGAVPLALAALAVVVCRREGADARRLTLTAVAGIAGFGLLSFGRDVTAFGWSLGPGPYRLFHAFVPGFQMVRIPERFALLVMFWLAILAGMGSAVLLRRAGARRTAAAAALAGLVFLEHLSVPLPTIPIPVGREVPEVYRWLRTQPVRKVVEVPLYGPWLNRLDSLPMYFAIGSERALVNGYTGFYPPAYAFLRHKLSSEPGPFFLETLERLGIDHVVVHPHLWKEREREAWLEFLNGSVDRLRPVRSFPEAPRRPEPAWDHGGEVVYAVRRPGQAPEPEAVQRTVVRPTAAWTVSASRGTGPAVVLDGDPATDWGTGDVSTTGDFLEVRFHEDLEVGGVGLSMSHSFTTYPGLVEVSIRRPDGRWRLMRFDRVRADRALLATLLRTGRDVWYSIDFEPVQANGLRVLVVRGDPMLEEWRVGELRVHGSATGRAPR